MIRLLLPLVTVGLGVALLIATAAQGGGQVGYLLGGLFIAAGAARIYVARSTRREG